MSKSLYMKDEELDLIKKAAEIDRRSMNSIIRKGSITLANKIISENE